MQYDESRIDESILALLGAFKFDNGRVWKRFDFDAMDRLYAKGLITNPRGRQESVHLTPEGLALAKRLAAECFGTGGSATSAC